MLGQDNQILTMNNVIIEDLPITDSVTITVSGVQGKDAINGINGSHGHSGFSGSNGGNGHNGTDAGSSSQGEDAGSIIISLKTYKQEFILVTGEKIVNQISSPFQFKVPFIDSSIKLYANGGRGGNGGFGGNGGNGGHGGNGRDATSSWRGEDGGNGGNGGNGGRGTSGSNGGNGGEIIVQVHQDDTDLLLLIYHEIDGGLRGKSGLHGKGGSGGYGGSGGSSYSWTESHTRSVHTTDADGNSHWDTETYYTHHSNPGGSSGFSGRSGYTPSDPLYSGADGNIGKFSIEVISEDNKKIIHEKRYDLDIIGVEFFSTNADTIIEPEEHVSTTIKIKNVGGMPTPNPYSLQLYVHNTEWIEYIKEVTIDIPVVIDTNQEYIFDQKIEFEVKKLAENDLGIENRLMYQGELGLGILAKRVNKIFPNALEKTQFSVTYPIEMSAISTARSIVVNKNENVTFEVENLSTISIGSSTRMARIIQYEIMYVDGTARQNELLLSTVGEIFSPITFFSDKISEILENQKITLNHVIKYVPEAQPYTSTTIDLLLYLGEYHKPSIPKLIQKRSISIQVANIYKRNSNAGFLLVTNNRTTQQEYLEWLNVGKRLGISLVDWNVGYYSYLVFLDIVKDSNSILAEDFRGKTIILLNNSFDENTSVVSNTKYIKKEELALIVRDYSINLLIIGTEGGKYNWNDLISELDLKKNKTTTTKETIDYESISEYKDKLKELNYPEKTNIDEYVPIYKISWFKPNEKFIIKKFNNISNFLKKIHPAKQFSATYTFVNTKKIAHFNWKKFWKNEFYCGYLTISHSISKLSSLSIYNTTDSVHEILHTEKSRVLFGICHSLQFIQKMHSLQTFSTQESVIGENYKFSEENLIGITLYQSILLDLLHERLLQEHGTIPKWTNENWLNKKLKKFAFVCEIFSTLSIDLQIKFIIDLCIQGKSRKRYRDSLLRITTRKQISNHYDAFRKSWFTDLKKQATIDENYKILTKKINSIIKGEINRLKQKAKDSKMKFSRYYCEEMYSVIKQNNLQTLNFEKLP